MKFIKKYSKIIGYMFLIITISTFFITILNYFDITNKGLTSIFKIFIILISMFIGGIIIGKKSNKKGYLEGTKLGLIFSSILFILTLILGNFSLKSIFYFIILIMATIFGSMVGINKNKG